MKLQTLALAGAIAWTECGAGVFLTPPASAVRSIDEYETDDNIASNIPDHHQGSHAAAAYEYGALGLAAADQAIKRALPDSPSGGYAPGNVTCPENRPSIRDADGLSSNETEWLKARRQNTVQPMKDLLERLNIPNFDAPAYVEHHKDNTTALPNIGIAVSGGGYRALMNGAGFLAAADDRTTNSTNAGGIGGLLQASTYLAGLSGGGWLVGSMFTNNFSSVQTLRDGYPDSSLWKFQNSILKGPQEPGISILNTASYYGDVKDQVQQKRDGGFNVSITDYWGRALSYQLINAESGGPAYTFSSIALDDKFSGGNTPMPMLVADGRNPGELIVSLNATVYEFNPFEMGSWDPTVYAFAPLRYLGSQFENGTIPDNRTCVEGFDNAGFVMGTSSSLFNQFLLQLSGTNSTILTDALTAVLSDIGKDNNDIAQYQPNPFYHYRADTNPVADNFDLSLVDGGEDLQNLPLNPLIQPSRNVDVIFAVDSSADTEYFWPNATALVATYERALNQTINNNTAFPSIPDQNTIVNLGLNQRPTFFGCDPTNSTQNMSGSPPLVVYIPNAPYITFSNVSTFDLDYNETQRNAIIQNGYDVATVGNFTLDSEWGVCVGCAILSRSMYKTGQATPQACEQCFERYCWNGEVNSTKPDNYNPGFKVEELSLMESGAENVSFNVVAAALVLCASVVAMM